MKKFMLNLALCLMFACSACTQQSDSIEEQILNVGGQDLTNRTLTTKDCIELGKTISQIRLKKNPDGTRTVLSKSGKEINVEECYFDYIVKMIDSQNKDIIARKNTRSDDLQDCISRPDDNNNKSNQRTDCVAYSIAHAINQMDKLPLIKMRLEERYGTQGIPNSKISEAMYMFGNWIEVGETQRVYGFMYNVNQGVVIAKPSKDNPDGHAVNIWGISDDGYNYATIDYQNPDEHSNPQRKLYDRSQLSAVFILIRPVIL